MVLPWASQSSKSTVLQNVIGYVLDCETVPALYIVPTKDNCTEIISPKLDQLIRHSPLAEKTNFGHQIKALHKKVAGVALRLAWSGSAAQIAAEPAGLVVIDEDDRCDQNPGGEGDLKTVADARHTTFPGGTTVVASSPTEAKAETKERKGLDRWSDIEPDFLASPVWRKFLQGTRHEYAVPCRACRSYFIPRSLLITYVGRQSGVYDAEVGRRLGRDRVPALRECAHLAA